MMLRSANAINIDTKGRIAMPTRYRDGLMESCQGQFVCTIDLQSTCLLIYPLNEWLVIEKKLSTLSSTDAVERRVQRLILGYATEAELDKGGRLLIAPALRAHAKLDKKVMLVGQFNKFELWDEDMWQQQVESDLQLGLPSADQLTESLKGFSL